MAAHQEDASMVSDKSFRPPVSENAVSEFGQCLAAAGVGPNSSFQLQVERVPTTTNMQPSQPPAIE